MSEALRVESIGHTYGADTKAPFSAVGDITFELEQGQVACIVGPSGCGKSTLMRIMAGLMRPTNGTVAVGGTAIDGVPKELAMVFQDYSRSLFPWLRVRQNVEYPLKHIDKPTRRELAVAALAEVGLYGHENKYPWELSGGMQQRVAIARALAVQPRILLMDEPFASVDAQTRAGLEDLVLSIQAETGITIVLVTHDIDESVYLADRVVALSAHPSTVLEVIDVDLSRPRDQLATKEHPDFLAYRHRVYQLLHGPKTVRRVGGEFNSSSSAPTSTEPVDMATGS